MKLPLSWLAEYVPVTLPARALAERLTMSGSLVEQITNTGEQWREIVIARVRTLERHPNADTLWLATLDLGAREQMVVTGAPNLFVGAIVPFVPTGATLPGQQRPLEAKTLRGIRSEGMVCSGRELGLNDDHSGILILNEQLQERDADEWIGQSLADFLGETVLDLDITPNRPDCLSIYGLAREVAAVTQSVLRPLVCALVEDGAAVHDLAWVRLEAPELCARCTARVIEDVTIGPSPEWLVKRLHAAGVRSINNVVDVTNYVMLELGQPLHAYDLDSLAGHGIAVRRARPGERLRTLDGVERVLSADMLVIADERGPVGLAGVMGSAHTEVRAETQRVLLEAATFNGRSIRRTSTDLGLRSEASTRFEKGLPVQLAALASTRAAALLADLAGGRVADGMLDAGIGDTEPRIIDFPLSEVPRLLGVEWPPARVSDNLEALGFRCTAPDPHHLRVTVPWWRDDVEESADLVEEVARVTGFDAIPETLLSGAVPPRPPSPYQRWNPRVRQLLLACGLSEASSPALVARTAIEMLRPEGAGEAWLDLIIPHAEAVHAAGARCEAVRVVNPLSPDREYLRPTLIAGLLEALRNNLRAGEDRVAFFELDSCAYARPGAQPLERRTLALAIAGLHAPRTWSQRDGTVDFYDLKGIVERLLTALGFGSWALERAKTPLLHPGRSAEVRLGDQLLGHFGELHPLLAARWDLAPHRSYVAEFDFDALAALASEARAFTEFSRLPVAKRDLAVVLDIAVPASDLLRVLQDSGKELLRRSVLFDSYQGEQLPPGKKSLAVSLEFQATDRTLTDEEVEKLLSRMRRAVQHRLGATVRT
jgi:phenylalanyl-tRNA synthetase beta chain